jgi:hypothetical protein
LVVVSRRELHTAKAMTSKPIERKRTGLFRHGAYGPGSPITG